MPEHLLDLAVMLRADADLQEQVLMSRLAGRLGYVAVHLPLPASGVVDPALVERLIEAAEPAMVVVDDGGENPGIVRRNDPLLVAAARAALDAAEDSRPLVVAVPLSIGRTYNEAVARADRDQRFVDDAHPQASRSEEHTSELQSH